MIRIIIVCAILCITLIVHNINNDSKYYYIGNVKVKAEVSVAKTVIPLKERQKVFFDKYVGKCVDFDMNYGCQCVDIVNLYLLEVYNTYPVIKNVFASDMGIAPSLIIPKSLKYEHLDYSNNLEYGDIVFWTSKQNKISNHVAIYIGDDKILSQNNVNDLKKGSSGEIVKIFPGVTKIIKIK